MRFWQTLFFAAFAALTLDFPVSDTDIWWHLAAGRWIVEHGAIPRVDPFCRSSLGVPWTDLHWGFQLVAWKIWNAMGNPGLILFRGLAATAAFAIALRWNFKWRSMLVACLGLWISREFLDVRPLLVTLLVLAVVQTSLDRPGPPKPWALGLACVGQLFLVNTQGLFLLGPLLVLGLAIGRAIERRRSDALVLAATATAMAALSLVNPWGSQAFELAGRVASRIVPRTENVFSWEISENAPLWIWIRDDATHLVALLWMAVGAILSFRRGEGAPGRLVLLAGTGILALFASRNLPLLALEICFCLAPTTISAWNRSFVLASGSVCAICLAIAFQQRRWDLPDTWTAPARLPGQRALSILSNEPGRVFHELRIGGWLSWKIPAHEVCWADTRLVLHDARFVSDYLRLADHPDEFQAFSERNGFRYALLPTFEFPRFHALARTLLGSARWSLVDADGAWALFRLRDSSSSSPGIDSDRIDAGIHGRFGTNPRLESAVRRNLATNFGLEVRR